MEQVSRRDQRIERLRYGSISQVGMYEFELMHGLTRIISYQPINNAYVGSVELSSFDYVNIFRISCVATKNVTS